MEIDEYLSEKQKKKKKKQAYLRLAIALGALYLVVAGVAWLVFQSPLFAVYEVRVEGNEAVPSGDVISLLQAAALRDHGFWRSALGFGNMLVWPNALASSDLAFIPELSSVTVVKSYAAHTITAHVTERKPFAIWCLMPTGAGNGTAASAGTPDIAANERCYWFDAQGVAFEKAFDTEGSLVFAVHDYSGSNSGLGLGKTILPPEFAPNMVSIINVIRESGIDAKEIALSDIGLQQINVTTYGGPVLYFSLRFPADEDLAVLQSLMAQPGFSKLQYLDFTVENRAYYR